MLHTTLYTLHVLGMILIITIAFYIWINKNIVDGVRKKLSLLLMSSAHTQLLTGFALFFLLMPDVNHMKIGIKMLLAIDVAVIATVFRKKIAKNETPNPSLIVIVLLSAMVTAIVAFIF
ncbi:MAG: hypothetical protein WDA22_08630 [Bacteroidota bacterium]